MLSQRVLIGNIHVEESFLLIVIDFGGDTEEMVFARKHQDIAIVTEIFHVAFLFTANFGDYYIPV